LHEKLNAYFKLDRPTVTQVVTRWRDVSWRTRSDMFSWQADWVAGLMRWKFVVFVAVCS